MPYITALHSILQKYELLKTQFKQNTKSGDVTNTLQELYRDTHQYLSPLDRERLISDRSTKNYFAFKTTKPNNRIKLSRAVNKDLYSNDPTIALTFFNGIRNRNITAQSADEITKACYTIAISFCCSIDLLKDSDQKTPGTFFEYFMGHLFSIQLDIIPQNKLSVLNLDMHANLPTDFIFDLGENKPKFHVPIKTSTRERVVQVWAHQRVLDGVYGTGRFLGLLSCLSETKLDHRSKVVTEICLPDQWRIYQMFISQLTRVYYLDIPSKYEELNNYFPCIHVKKFGEFFYEYEELSK